MAKTKLDKFNALNVGTEKRDKLSFIDVITASYDHVNNMFTVDGERYFITSLSKEESNQ